jgi:lysozyme family protein
MTLVELNAQRWQRAKLTRGPEFAPVAKRLLANKARYQRIERQTGVPWYVIAVIHNREAGYDPEFRANIANGEPWNRQTRLVPKGRGPFGSFDAAAYDALVNCAPYAGRNRDWSPGGTLTLLEKYNGLGYSNKGIPSPYIWSGTDQYQKGKYVADGVFDPNVVDKQLGCAGLLMAMGVTFGAVPKAPDVEPPTPPTPPQPKPEKNFWQELFAAIASIFNQLFGKR